MEERIHKIRTSDLQIEVRDASGKPVPNAEVHVETTRSAFLFVTKWSSFDWFRAGSVIDTEHLFLALLQQKEGVIVPLVEKIGSNRADLEADIIQAIKKAGSRECVMMLDEASK